MSSTLNITIGVNLSHSHILTFTIEHWSRVGHFLNSIFQSNLLRWCIKLLSCLLFWTVYLSNLFIVLDFLWNYPISNEAYGTLGEIVISRASNCCDLCQYISWAFISLTIANSQSNWEASGEDWKELRLNYWENNRLRIWVQWR